MTKIEWTEQTWNPIVGCSIVSPGCTNCYAMKMARRIGRMSATQFPHYDGLTKMVNGNAVWTGKLAQAGDHILTAPLRRRKPTMYFVNSMSDLFHEDVPDEWIDRVFAVMALTPQHTFQVLTKRAARMRRYMAAPGVERRIYELVCDLVTVDRIADVILIAPGTDDRIAPPGTRIYLGRWPLSNVWLGVSAERQQEADARIPDLLATPAAVRFVSAESLLGPIDFTRIGIRCATGGSMHLDSLTGRVRDLSGFEPRQDGERANAIDWIIVGGESGAGARPMHPDWVRSIRDQCTAAGTAFFFKQWGEWAPETLQVERGGELSDYDGGEMKRFGKRLAGRTLDGHEWMEWPTKAHAAQPPEATAERALLAPAGARPATSDPARSDAGSRRNSAREAQS